MSRIILQKNAEKSCGKLSLIFNGRFTNFLFKIIMNFNGFLKISAAGNPRDQLGHCFLKQSELIGKNCDQSHAAIGNKAIYLSN